MIALIKKHIKLILICIGFTIVAFLLLNRNMIEETFASDFWHRGKLVDSREFIEYKKEQSEKVEENFEPNENLISKYSHFEISAEQKDMLEDPSMDLLTDVKDLEDTNFLQPVSYFDQYATIDEVTPNSAGSGDLKEMTSAFQNADKDRFYENIKFIESRGNNR